MTNDIVIRDVFDDCYPAHEDYTAALSLRYDRSERCWKNEEVAFWKDDTLGWRFKSASGEGNYGYNSLREAVVSYSIGLSDLQRQGKTFCAHRLESTEYQQRVGSDELYCKTTWRFFMPECDDNRFAEKCEQLTQALNLSIGGMTF